MISQDTEKELKNARQRAGETEILYLPPRRQSQIHSKTDMTSALRLFHMVYLHTSVNGNHVFKHMGHGNYR